MKLALIADTFPPLRTSGAVQLRDLSREFVRQGHELTVLLPVYEQVEPWREEVLDGVRVLRLKAPKTKDINYVQRTLAEFWMPFAMKRSLRASPLKEERWDGVIWYAPSIFHGPLASHLKRKSRCPGYLIIRDIFPEWALDMGLMGKGLPYWFFRVIADYQYRVADVIGVQTEGNRIYFKEWSALPGHQLEVLQNWLGPTGTMPCTIDVARSALAGRKLFVYAGNMGVAQGMDILIDLADLFRNRQDVGFLFVGRGSEAVRLTALAAERGLDNVLFFDEIHPDEIPGLYAQCHIGLVALDQRHKSHNVPGKFITYMQCGLPVLARVNPGNDIGKLIRQEAVGKVCESADLKALHVEAAALLEEAGRDLAITHRCRELFASRFSVETAVAQIIRSLANVKKNGAPFFSSL